MGLLSQEMYTHKAYHCRILLECKCVCPLLVLTTELQLPLAGDEAAPLPGHVQDIEVDAVGRERDLGY